MPAGTPERPSLAEHKREWEEIAEQDAPWAILSVPGAKYGAWDTDALFRTGEEEIAELETRLEALGRPARRERALDFGCGIGRLTRALAARFQSAVGVDISEAMVRQARELNGDVPGASFELNVSTDLRMFEDAGFDLVYSRVVLQHLPDAETVAGYLRELLRVLRPDGLLVFQLPSSVPMLVRLQPRRRLYLLLRRLGVAPARLYWRLGLHPMRMLAVSPADVERMVKEAGGLVLRVDTARDPSFGFEDSVYFAAPAEP